VNAAYEENEDYLFESFRWKGWTKGDTNKLHRLPKGIDLRLWLLTSCNREQSRFL